MNPFVELAEVAATFYGLYWLSRLAQWMHRPRAAPAAASSTGAAPAVVPQARDTEPYRMDAGVAVGGPDPGRYESMEVVK